MKLHIKRYGKGNPVILVHGGPGLPGYMHQLGVLLKDHFSIVEYFQRDYIGSNARGSFTIDSYVADLHSVVDKCELQKPIIVAHSFGCSLAVELAKRHPAKLANLVLLNPVLDGQSWDLFVKRLRQQLRRSDSKISEKLARAEKRLKSSAGNQAQLQALRKLHNLYWPGYFPSGKKPADLSFAGVNVKAVGRIERDYLRKLREGVFLRDLHRIKVPVTQIHGTLDPVPWRIVSARLRKGVPRFKNRLINNSGHFPWMDIDGRNAFVAALKGTISPSNIGLNGRRPQIGWIAGSRRRSA